MVAQQCYFATVSTKAAVREVLKRNEKSQKMLAGPTRQKSWRISSDCFFLMGSNLKEWEKLSSLSSLQPILRFPHGFHKRCPGFTQALSNIRWTSFLRLIQWSNGKEVYNWACKCSDRGSWEANRGKCYHIGSLTNCFSNTVVVKKKIGKWMVCVDFTSLNRACPRVLILIKWRSRTLS